VIDSVTNIYAHLAAAFQDGTIQDESGSTLSIRTLPIGDLIIVSGALMACDAIIGGGTDAAFTTPVPPGTYPVLLSVATHLNGAQSVACAMVRFAYGTAVRWEMATVKGQDPSELEADEIFGYGVDSGTGCFMDAALAPAPVPEDADGPPYAAFDDEEEERMGAILQQMRRTEPRWANLVRDRATGANIVAFDSGYGDGVYASFFGYDAQDQLVCLVTDFGVLP
jgi:Protein of unknown function (DUF4241)